MEEWVEAAAWVKPGRRLLCILGSGPSLVAVLITYAVDVCGFNSGGPSTSCGWCFESGLVSCVASGCPVQPAQRVVHAHIQIQLPHVYLKYLVLVFLFSLFV